MITINYGGSNVFSGISETPFVSRSIGILYNYGHQGVVDKFTLNGRIKVGPCEASGQFQSIYTLQRLLISRLSKNFQSFSIVDGLNTVYSADSAIVESIRFDDSTYFNLLPFSIEVVVYRDGFAANGILDPSEEFVFENSEDCSGTLVHTISARGINNSIEAIENVRTFVVSRMGWSNQISPAFVSLNTPILKSREEKINRLDGSYSIVERYIFDTSESPSTTGILQYSIDINESNNGEVVVSINGDIEGGINTNISDLRADLVSVNWFNLAQAEYLLIDPIGTLSTSPTTYSVTEDSNILSFKFEFSNKAYSGPYIVDSTNIKKNFESNERCITYKAIIRSDYGCPSKRWSEVSSYYDTLSIESLARTAWDKYGDGTRLGLFPVSRSYSQNEQQGIITAELTFCNARGETCGCLEKFDYKLDFSPAIPVYVASPTLAGEGCYHVQNYGYNKRAVFSINGEVIVSNCCSIDRGISELKSKLNQLNAQYFSASDKVLLSFKIDKNENSRILNFSCSWGGESISEIPSSLYEL